MVFDNRVKLIAGAVIGLIAIIAIYTVGSQLITTNNAGFVQVKQGALSGELSIHDQAYERHLDKTLSKEEREDVVFYSNEFLYTDLEGYDEFAATYVIEKELA